MRRILSVAGAVALLAAAGAGTVAAQAPTPPTRFFGTAQLDGRAAADGTTVTAFVGSNNCGSGTVTGGSYTVDVASANTKTGCGTDGATVSFTVGAGRASQTGTFQTGAFVPLNLTATQATATPAPTTAPTARPTTAPTTAAQRPAAPPQAAAPAPRLPATGTGTTSESGSMWLLGGFALVLALAGGAGIAVARRR